MSRVAAKGTVRVRDLFRKNIELFFKWHRVFIAPKQGSRLVDIPIVRATGN
jgi:hypothetical protein